ncbi:hypothetical protein [uncultured Barnesiella sp.]|uniref:hypothetical protein n=1 Tax=uncultured Barnesiella sp. TaxID=584861 RepID=UPI002607AC8B|nr:hypothetical protein [uncultured Barnesiella sp.]
MGTYKLKTGKVEAIVVDAYKRLERGVVRGYERIEKKFVDRFLEPVEKEERP